MMYYEIKGVNFNMDINKRADESLKDYKIRLFQHKKEYGLSNQDVTDLINNESNTTHHHSTYRRWWAAYQEGYKDAMNIEQSDNDILCEAKMTKQQAQDMRSETNRWLRETARHNLFSEQLFEAIKNNLTVAPITYYPREKPDSVNRNGVLFISDQHYGAEFTIHGVHGEILNEYSPEIFEQRMKIVLKETVEQVRKYHLNKVYIMSCGDSLDGFLRHSQLMKLRWGVVDCTVKYAHYMFNWLTALSQFVDVEFHTVQGNHTELRLLDGKKNQHEEENLDKIIVDIIDNSIKLTNNHAVRIMDTNSAFAFMELPCGYNIFGFHGETKNLEKAWKDFENIYHINIDYLACGHLHHYNNVQLGYRKAAIRVGSIIGVDDYSMKIKQCADATASFGVFEENKGLVDLHTIVLN